MCYCIVKPTIFKPVIVILRGPSLDFSGHSEEPLLLFKAVQEKKKMAINNACSSFLL